METDLQASSDWRFHLRDFGTLDQIPEVSTEHGWGKGRLGWREAGAEGGWDKGRLGRREARVEGGWDKGRLGWREAGGVIRRTAMEE